MISIEKMSADEIQSLGVYEQGRALNEIMIETMQIGRAAITARTSLAKFKCEVLQSSPSAKDECRERVILAQSILDNLRARSQTLRELRSILQTLLRSSNI